ncbi:DNA ligase 4 [Trichoplax sp. H2]|nr:DNA ligase 4 [Trichoplax sp. H2]|eukprot:RDD46321.1 DNA ligase 4 [Trichoplax sp. H2]
MATKTVADEVPFFDLCTLLERISQASGKEKKKKIYSDFLSSWRTAHFKLYGKSSTEDSFFSAMRLLLPQMDKERLAYGMKETALAKYYIDILSISKESPAAQKLMNYRAPAAAKQDAGDFASVAFFVLRTRCPEKGTLSIADVNECLDNIAMANSQRKRDDVRNNLRKLLRNTCAMEQKWLIRMIMKELKVGLSENSIFSVFHPDASDLFNVSSSLSKVCSDLMDPDVRLNETSIELFVPFRPMLAERCPLQQVEKLMNHEMFYIECKADGDRMQLHKDGNKYMYFSRSSKEYTSSFGATPDEGSFTPFIVNVFSSQVQSAILDGEMVGYDMENDCYVPRGENIDVKAVGRTSAIIQQCYMVFDILMLNGKKLANHSLHERLGYLKQVFTPIPGRIMVVKQRQATSKKDVLDSLNEAIDTREEGIIIKNPISTYKPDQRKGSGWFKIKPEYVDSLSDQLDLLIIGGYFGVGRRGGLISHFLLGVAVPPENPSEHPKVFQSFCKVGSGYTIAELKELGEKLKPYWKPMNPKKLPPYFQLMSEKPDLWIEPIHSKIVQIKAAEIVPSTDKFKCNCTLRYPRVELVREDKYWYECMDLDELDQLKSIAEGRLAYQHADEASETLMFGPSKKRQKANIRPETVCTIAPQFRTADISDVSQVFSGKEFCVVSGPKHNPKASVEKRIVENGGTFVQNPGMETFCVITDRKTIRARNIISQNIYDVVKVDWLLDSLAAGRCLEWQPNQVIHSSPKTAEVFAKEYDKYGDSYTKDIDNPVALKAIFDKINNEDDLVSTATQKEICDVEMRYFPDESPLGLFRRCRAYFDWYRQVDNDATRIRDSPLDLIGLNFRYYGGTISSILDRHVTHIVFDPSDLSRMQKLRKLDKNRKLLRHFVGSEWVTASIDAASQLSERNYEPLMPRDNSSDSEY